MVKKTKLTKSKMLNHQFFGLTVCFIHMYIQFEYSSFLTMILFISSAQDIVHDRDTQAEDWHIAIEAFCEVICQTISFV